MVSASLPNPTGGVPGPTAPLCYVRDQASLLYHLRPCPSATLSLLSLVPHSIRCSVDSRASPSAPWPPALLLRSLGFVSLSSLRSWCATSLAPSGRTAPRREGSGYPFPAAPGQYHHTAPLRYAHGGTAPTPPPGHALHFVSGIAFRLRARGYPASRSWFAAYPRRKASGFCVPVPPSGNLAQVL